MDPSFYFFGGELVIGGRDYIRYPLVNVYTATENGPFIVDLPIKHRNFPHLCKRLPEGN